MADVTLIYWDACIFYEWLHGNQPDPRRRYAITQCLQQNERKELRIFTSTITHLEVLPKKSYTISDVKASTGREQTME